MLTQQRRQDYVKHYNPPSGMLYSTKEGEGDFYLRVGDNPLLASTAAPKLRGFSVELDVFRQYESCACPPSPSLDLACDSRGFA